MGLGKQTVLTKIITKLLRTKPLIPFIPFTLRPFISICHVDTVPLYTHCFPVVFSRFVIMVL
jgi:hypothetical protein